MQAKWPKTGDKILKNEAAQIDYSNINEGYIIAWVYDADPQKKFKIRLEEGGRAQNFSAHPAHKEIYIPMVFGTGIYRIAILRQVSGSQYKQVLSLTEPVKLISALSPWLHPTAYCEYFPDSKCVQVAADICRLELTDFDCLKKITSWVIDNLEYDHALAAVVNDDKTSFWIPEPDAVLAKKKGICWECASLTAAMLRSQGVPAKIVVGWVGAAYHAWNEVYLTTDGFLEPGCYLRKGAWALLDLTTADVSGSFKVPSGVSYKVDYYG